MSWRRMDDARRSEVDELIDLCGVLTRENRALTGSAAELDQRARKAHREERARQEPRGVDDHPTEGIGTGLTDRKPRMNRPADHRQRSRILDKEYQVACPAEEVDALTASAQYLDRQMSEIRDTGKIFGLDQHRRDGRTEHRQRALEQQGQGAMRPSQRRGAGSRSTRSRTRVGSALAEQKQLNL